MNLSISREQALSLLITPIIQGDCLPRPAALESLRALQGSADDNQGHS